jgi:hypothetical protein
MAKKPVAKLVSFIRLLDTLTILVKEGGKLLHTLNSWLQ